MGFQRQNTQTTVSQEEPRINALKYEQSTFGATKSVVYGTNRICGNIIDSVDFTSIAHTTTTGGGAAAQGKGGRGGGGGGQTQTTYTYKSRVLIGLCYGEIQGIKKILIEDEVHSLSDLGFNLFRGTKNQGAWGEMRTRHPERALNYRNLAYVAGYIDLTSSASVPQFNFEVNGKFTSNTDDIDPVITEGFSFSTSEGTLTTASASLDYAQYYISDKSCQVVYYTANGEERTIENFSRYSKNGNSYTFNFGGLGATSAHVYLNYNSTVRLDANPKDIIFDILTDKTYGMGFPEDAIDNLQNFSDFCIASNVFISPVYDTQTEAQEILSDIAEIANSTFVWSQGKLKLVPLGDAEITANGKTWTPDLTPIYDLTADDFLGDDEPVLCSRTQQADVYNSVKLEYLNRANDYNIEVVEAQDLADIELHGLRPADTIKAHQICTDEVAQRTVQLALERMLAARNTYKFRLPLKFILLEPADIVTITYEPLGLDRELVRIKSIHEDEGEFELEVEELVVGAATPAKIAHQRAEGTKIDYSQTVGNVNPAVVFEPPMELTQQTLEVWVGVSSPENLFGGVEVWISDDGETYRKEGEITQPVRQGILTETLPLSNEDIDKVHDLCVDVSMSHSELLSGTKQDSERLNTLCYVDGELLAYADAELVDDFKYELSYLNRSAYATEAKAHNAGTQFCRIDTQAFLKIPFTKDDIGRKIAVKLPSFNSFRSGFQSLAEVESYFYTIKGTALLQAPEDIQGLTSYYSDGFNILEWNPVDDTRNIVYEIRKGDSWAKGQVLGRIAANRYTANGNGTYFIKAFAPDYGVYSERAVAITISGARIVQNVIAVHDEKNEGWQGIKSQHVTVNEFGELTLSSTTLVSEIEVFSKISSLIYGGTIATYGTYEANNIIDIGAAATCYIFCDYQFAGEDPFSLFSQIKLLSLVQNLSGSHGAEIVNSRIQIAIAGDDDEFGEWQDFIAGEYFGKKFKFRAILASSSESIVAKLQQFKINVDVPDIVETGNGVVIPVEGTTIQFAKHFHAVPNVQVTILNKEQGDDEIISNPTTDSFDIIITNNEQPVQKTINYVVQGY